MNYCAECKNCKIINIDKFAGVADYKCSKLVYKSEIDGYVLLSDCSEARKKFENSDGNCTFFEQKEYIIDIVINFIKSCFRSLLKK